MRAFDEKLIAWAALIGAALFVRVRGGPIERWGYAAIALNWLAMPLVEVRSSWFSPQYGIILADAALAVLLSLVALKTTRLWPIAGAAFEWLGTIARVVALGAPLQLTRAVFYADAVAGYLVLGSLIGGIIVEAYGEQREGPVRARA